MSHIDSDFLSISLTFFLRWHETNLNQTCHKELRRSIRKIHLIKISPWFWTKYHRNLPVARCCSKSVYCGFMPTSKTHIKKYHSNFYSYILHGQGLPSTLNFPYWQCLNGKARTWAITLLGRYACYLYCVSILLPLRPMLIIILIRCLFVCGCLCGCKNMCVFNSNVTLWKKVKED